jgi:curved DNA-binding protein CbpA
MQDLYTILGVSPDASDEDIRHAYRQIARRLHPDVNQHPGAGRQFKDISAAHDILGNLSSRAQYDVKRRGQVTKQYLDIRVTPSAQVVSQMTEPQAVSYTHLRAHET